MLYQLNSRLSVVRLLAQQHAKSHKVEYQIKRIFTRVIIRVTESFLSMCDKLTGYSKRTRRFAIGEKKRKTKSSKAKEKTEIPAISLATVLYNCERGLFVLWIV